MTKFRNAPTGGKLVDRPGGDKMIRRIPIIVRVDSDGNVDGCTSIAHLDLATKICTDLEGTMVSGSCSLANSPAVKRTVCDVFGMTWTSGNGCGP